MDYRVLRDIPSYQLLPTGVGGVLYPPHAIPRKAFCESDIQDTCLYCDDLWLKMYCVYNHLPVVLPQDSCGYRDMPEAKETALWYDNIRRGNDAAMKSILDLFDAKYQNKEDLLHRIWQDRFV